MNDNSKYVCEKHGSLLFLTEEPVWRSSVEKDYGLVVRFAILCVFMPVAHGRGRKRGAMSPAPSATSIGPVEN